MAAPKPKLKIPDYENYSSVDPRLGEPVARPKAPACPPQQEPAATKRQASDDAPLQAPPSQFLAPEEQQPNGEQRPDPTKKARPSSPPGELRVRTEREWLNLSAHEILRLPKEENMEVIHWSAIPFHWLLRKIFPCAETSCKPHCFHCACAANGQGMKVKLLAGEAATKDVRMFWKDNASHNGTEDPGHQPIIPYEDRLGVASGKALIT